MSRLSNNRVPSDESGLGCIRDRSFDTTTARIVRTHGDDLILHNATCDLMNIADAVCGSLTVSTLAMPYGASLISTLGSFSGTVGTFTIGTNSMTAGSFSGTTGTINIGTNPMTTGAINIGTNPMTAGLIKINGSAYSGTTGILTVGTNAMTAGAYSIQNSSENQILGMSVINVTTSSDPDFSLVKARTDPKLQINVAEGAYDFTTWVIEGNRWIEITGDTRACAAMSCFMNIPVEPRYNNGVKVTNIIISGASDDTLTILVSGIVPIDFAALDVTAGDTILYWDDTNLNELTDPTRLAGKEATVVSTTDNTLTFAANTFTGCTFSLPGSGFIILPNVHLTGACILNSSSIIYNGVVCEYNDDDYSTVTCIGSRVQSYASVFRTLHQTTAAIVANDSNILFNGSMMTCCDGFHSANIVNLINSQTTFINCTIAGCNNLDDYSGSMPDSSGSLRLESGSCTVPMNDSGNRFWLHCLKTPVGILSTSANRTNICVLYITSCYGGLVAYNAANVLVLWGIEIYRVYAYCVASIYESVITVSANTTIDLSRENEWVTAPPSAIGLSEVYTGGIVHWEDGYLSANFTAPSVATVVEFTDQYPGLPNVNARILPNVPGIEPPGLVTTSVYENSASVPYCYETVFGYTALSGSYATPTTQACPYITTTAIIASSIASRVSTNASTWYEIIPATPADAITFRSEDGDTSVINWRILMAGPIA